MRLGAVEYVLGRGDDSVRFANARRLGLAGVEIILTREQLRAPEAPRLNSLQQAMRASGLEIPSLMLSEHNGGGIASASPDVAEAAKEDVRQAIEWAAELGAKVILVPFFFGGDILTDDDFERAALGFGQLCPLAERRGVTLCYEGTLPAARIRELASQVGAESEAFGCYFDLANVLRGGMDTVAEIRALGGLIRQVHMKDTLVGANDRRPGLGDVDFEHSAAALYEVGYDGWLVLETPAGPPELVARDISFTRAHFHRLEGAARWPVFGAFSYGYGKGELDRLIEDFTRSGLGAVQLGTELLQEALEDPKRASEMGARLEAGGIEVAGLAGYRNLTAPDGAKRRENIEFLKRCLEIAPLLGTSVVATETGTRHPESDWLPSVENGSQEAWDSLHGALEELLEVAGHHGSVLALEGYVNNVLQTQEQLADLLERFPTQHLQVVLDPFNYLSSDLLPEQGRATQDFLNEFESRFVIAHLKDVSAEGAEVDTPELGKGVFEYSPYLEFLRTRRPDLPLILEHLPFEHVPEAVERVSRLAGIR